MVFHPTADWHFIFLFFLSYYNNARVIDGTDLQLFKKPVIWIHSWQGGDVDEDNVQKNDGNNKDYKSEAILQRIADLQELEIKRAFDYVKDTEKVRIYPWSSKLSSTIALRLFFAYITKRQIKGGKNPHNSTRSFG